MNQIPKKITPADLKRDGVYFKKLKSGKIKTREIADIYPSGIPTASCVVSFKSNPHRYIFADTVCRWADGVVEP